MGEASAANKQVVNIVAVLTQTEFGEGVNSINMVISRPAKTAA